MYEVELKVAADHGAVRAALPPAAEPLGTVEQLDTYYDAPHRDFAATDEALRLRREREVSTPAGTAGESGDGNGGEPDAGSDGADGGDWTTAITYKGPLVEAESKTREEFETEVADGVELAEALERLGFSPAAEVRKERERYRLEAFTISLDAVDGLGEYVEVETEQEDEDVATARERARALLRDLGCDPDEQIRTSYLGLLLAAEE